jgi:hypothetical protein
MNVLRFTTEKKGATHDEILASLIESLAAAAVQTSPILNLILAVWIERPR